MKTPLLVLAGIAVLALTACITDNGGPNVNDTYVEIHPGTKIDPDGQIQLARILSKYENKLYWVKNIDKAPEGELDCVYVDKAFLNELLQSTYNAGTAYSFIQIGARPTRGICVKVHHTPSLHHTPVLHAAFLHHTPNVSTHLTPADYDKARALVREVAPILQKYTHK